jgi:membrane-bound ClpP family serine protease
MLIWGLGLLAVALLLLVIDIFVPTMGVLSVVAGICTLAGLGALWSHDITWGISGTLAVMVLGPIIFFAGLKMYPHTPIGRRMIGAPSEEEQEAARRADEDERRQRAALLGAQGVVVTPLHPTGTVQVNDQRFEAICDTAILPAGARVKVVAVEGPRLRVRASA